LPRTIGRDFRRLLEDGIRTQCLRHCNGDEFGRKRKSKLKYIKIIYLCNKILQIKCHKYFPDLMEVMRYERIIIKCVQQAEFPVHTRRTFLVQENKVAIFSF